LRLELGPFLLRLVVDPLQFALERSDAAAQSVALCGEPDVVAWVLLIALSEPFHRRGSALLGDLLGALLDVAVPLALAPSNDLLCLGREFREDLAVLSFPAMRWIDGRRSLLLGLVRFWSLVVVLSLIVTSDRSFLRSGVICLCGRLILGRLRLLRLAAAARLFLGLQQPLDALQACGI
jgi:hypothetical protein